VETRPQNTLEQFVVMLGACVLVSVVAAEVCIWAQDSKVQGAWLIEMGTVLAAMVLVFVIWRVWSWLRRRPKSGDE